jgi:hypothetical protein
MILANDIKPGARLEFKAREYHHKYIVIRIDNRGVDEINELIFTCLNLKLLTFKVCGYRRENSQYWYLND